MLTFILRFFTGAAASSPPRAARPRANWNPDDMLVVTAKFDPGCAEHKRQRYERLSACRTVADAMKLTVQPTRAGPSRRYRRSDLAYDVKTGYVKVGL